jgi:hypothetical protein
MGFTMISARTRERRQEDLARMRQRFAARHIERRQYLRSKRPKTARELTLRDLAHACEIASRMGENPLFQEAMKECEGYFRDLITEESEQ